MKKAIVLALLAACSSGEDYTDPILPDASIAVDAGDLQSLDKAYLCSCQRFEDHSNVVCTGGSAITNAYQAQLLTGRFYFFPKPLSSYECQYTETLPHVTRIPIPGVTCTYRVSTGGRCLD